MGAHTSSINHSLRVTVVGPCASGKTTLVEGLRELGFEAWVTSQEHSAVPDLWNHLRPDALIALTVDLVSIRKRRGENWSSAIYESQLERLREAYEAADLIIDSAVRSPAEALDASVEYLRRLAQESYGPKRSES